MRYAICNELFGELAFDKMCQMIAQHGFHGVEIAPFTLFEDPRQVDRGTIREIARTLERHGLQFAGFHWLFARPAGLHITTPDSTIRTRSWDHLRRLVDIAGELGGGGLILGSPQQRQAMGIPVEQARTYLQEGLTAIAAYAEERRTTILLEALPAHNTNVINTLEAARRLIRQINHPGVNGMFDFHNSVDETLSWPELIETYAGIIQHVHLNELNGSYPGTGTSDFRPAFQQLAAQGYDGWVSLEIFEIPADPHHVLSETRTFLQAMENERH
ncbi:TIM barrel protein [candidate division KSB3 bacterium]|uniref:TIM barrel protein n=1 Tax=candidate division KSB3 bacterium TaxID=2044937 RepID=A0A9D5K090_9BACT|nr:TIM barrel protein [candidate division KSB3 bacterium]MBD3327260.1 TIM barrel protein [candidate division KSB3 bacterium]